MQHVSICSQCQGDSKRSPVHKSLQHVVGGLERVFHSVGNNSPNWLSHVSEGLKPATSACCTPEHWSQIPVPLRPCHRLCCWQCYHVWKWTCTVFPCRCLAGVPFFHRNHKFIVETSLPTPIWQSLYPPVIKHSYWKWPLIVDFPCKNCDFPQLC